MKSSRSLLSGLAGSLVLTIVHELTRKGTNNAPRMDLMGEQAITKLFHKGNAEPPRGKRLYWTTMIADLLGNALFYSLAGIGKNKKGAWARGGALGLAAGIGALVLPKRLGLNEDFSSRTNKTKAMTTGYYLIGGLVAAALMQVLLDEEE